MADAVIKAAENTTIGGASGDPVKEAVDQTGGKVVHEEHTSNVRELESPAPGTTGTVMEQRDSYVIKTDAAGGGVIGDTANAHGTAKDLVITNTDRKLQTSGDHHSNSGEQRKDMPDVTKTTDTYSEQLMRADGEGMPPAEIKQTPTKQTEHATSSTPTSPTASSSVGTEASTSEVLAPPPPESSPRYAELPSGENEKEAVLNADVLETLPPSMHHVQKFESEQHNEDEQKLIAEHKQHQRNAATEHRVGHMQTLDSGIFKPGEQAIPLAVERKEGYSVAPHYLVDENRDDDFLLNKTPDNNNNSDKSDEQHRNDNNNDNNNKQRESLADDTSTATSSSFERIESRGGSGFDSNGFEHIESPVRGSSPAPAPSYDREETAEVQENNDNSRQSTAASDNKSSDNDNSMRREERESESSSSPDDEADTTNTSMQKGGSGGDKSLESNEQRDTQQTVTAEKAADSRQSEKTNKSQTSVDSSAKMADYDDRTNRPQWNAAVRQDGADVTRPEMANLITGLDDSPTGDSGARGGGQQQYQQYSKTETTVTNNQENTRQEQRSPSGGRNSSQQQQQSSNNNNNNDDNNDESRYQTMQQGSENYNETEVRNRKNQQQQQGGGQQQGEYQQQRNEGRRGNNNQNDTEENEDSAYQQQQGGGQQRSGGQQQRGEESNYQQQQQGGGQQRSGGQQQRGEESNYQQNQQQGGQQRGGNQQQRGQQQQGEGQEQQGEGNEQQQRSNLERLRSRMSHSVNDVVMWRDVVHSASVFGVGLAMLLVVTWLPVTEMILYALLLAQTVALALCGLKYFMSKVSNTEFRHPLNGVIYSETTINPEGAHRMLDSVLNVLNAQLVQLKRLVLAEDIGTTLKFAALCWALTYFATWFSGLTLMFVFWISMFTLPKAYQVYKQPIDRHVGIVRNQIGNVEQMIVQKVPQLRPLLTGRGVFAMGTRDSGTNVNVNAGSPTRRGGGGGGGGGGGAVSTTTTTTTTASGGNRANRNYR